MAPIPSTALVLPSVTGPVLKLKSDVPADSTSLSWPEFWFELTWNNQVLRYTFHILTTSQPAPPEGYPLWIGLHGGGGSNLPKDRVDNNSSWCVVDGANTGWFNSSIRQFQQDPNGKPQPAVLVCTRGIDDDWDLHWKPESCVLMEHMIMNLIQQVPPEVKILQQNANYKNTPGLNTSSLHFVDPKQVMLWGFSAGGDGAFRLGPWMADRFAAVVPGAGHPGDSSFVDNTANLKLCLEVGEDDCYPRGGDEYEWSRSKVYRVLADQPLLDASAKLPVAERNNYYIHDCFIVKNEHRADGLTIFSPVGIDYIHEYWSWTQYINTAQNIVARSGFTNWTAKMADFEAKAIANKVIEVPYIDQSQTAYQPQDINPLKWCMDQNATRVALPKLVVWNLKWQPATPTNSPLGWQRRFFYWLYLRVPGAAEINLPTYKSEEVRYAMDTTNAVKIMIRHPNQYLGVFLPDAWLQKPVTVCVGEPGQETQIFSGTVPPVQTIRGETAEARGDPNLTFAAMIYLEPNNNSWIVRQETSLKTPKTF